MRCSCSCGTKRDVLVQNLIQGKSQSRGCISREKAWEKLYREMNQRVPGHNFRRLTPIKGVGRESLLKYLCRYTCGKGIEVLGSQLLAGFYRPCGCRRKEGYDDFDKIKGPDTQKLVSRRVEGMSLYAIRNRVQKNNSSGVRGVSRISRPQKCRTYITLRGEQKNLEIFKDLEDAKKAKKEVEEKYFKLILSECKDKLEEEKDD